MGNALGVSLRKLELAPDECDAVLAMLWHRAVAGTALVLIDGLDEITDPILRARFCRQLEQFHVAHPDTPMVVTSRIVGYRELGVRIGRGFEHLTLSDLAKEEKDEFAKRWCALTELPERRADAETGLIRDLHATQRIEALTGNPMLLTTMALVRRRIGKLPSRRVSLYEEAVKTLLNWRREVDEPLDEDEVLPQLRYLAYAMCDRGVQQLRQDEAVALLGEFRREYPQLRRAARRDPEDFLRLLERRTGILTETGEVRHDGELVPVYEFRHLTFQEYLAGLALVCGHFPGAGRYSRLAKRVAPLAARLTKPESCKTGVTESWREPLRLCLAACNDADTDDALLAILTPAAGEDAVVTGRGRAVQAALCLADEPNVTEAVADQVLRALVRHIDATDGGEDETTLDTAARELAASDWVGLLERHLCAEFQRRELATRTNVGRVHGLTSDALRPADGPDLMEWLHAQVAALALPDDREAISAALHLGRAAERSRRSIMRRRVFDAVPALMSTLNKCTNPVAHATTWALARLADPSHTTDGRPSWQPTTAELRRLHGYLTHPTTDDGAMSYIISILGGHHFSAAIPALSNLLHHPEAEVRREVALALGKLGDLRVAAPLLALLRGSNMNLWEEVAQALGRLGDRRAFPLLLERLSNPDAQVRRTAAWALERLLCELGDERALNPLLKSLDDADGDVRWAAIYALGRLGDARAVDSLLKLVDDTQDSVRWGIAWALRFFDDERAIDSLLKLLDDANANVRWLAAFALGNYDNERTVEPLIERLTDSDSRIRTIASQTLGELGDERVVNPLLQSLGDADADVRASAAQALGRLDDERTVNPLLKLLEDADPKVRERVAQGLGKLSDRRAMEPLLDRLGDADAGVRSAVVRAVGRLGDGRDLEALLDRLAYHDSLVRSASAKALGALSERHAVEPLLALLDDTETEVDIQAAAVEALGRLGESRAVEPVLQQLDDDEADVRRAAAESLGLLGDSRAVEPLLARLDDDLLDVRRAAAEGLGFLGDSRAVAPLLARLDDDLLDVRVAAAEALGRLGDERAVVPLLELLQSGGGNVRRAAAVALGRIGDPQALAELRQLLGATMRDLRVSALEGLSHTCSDETDRKLLTRDADGQRPFLDCKRLIGGLQIRRAARALKLSEEEVRCRYENLAERFPLRLAWRDE